MNIANTSASNRHSDGNRQTLWVFCDSTMGRHIFVKGAHLKAFFI